MQQELFIYYRIAAVHAEAALPLVQRWQADLRQRHPALQARLLKRPSTGASGDEETWMETYAAGPIAALHAELVLGPPALAAFGTIHRHVEAFVPCAS